jgi:DNA-binding NarL/FixJ family response regulator
MLNLTPKQKQVVALIVKGCDNQTIANELYISVNTVKHHISSICERLNVVTRNEVTAVWIDYVMTELYDSLQQHINNDVLDNIFNEVK